MVTENGAFIRLDEIKLMVAGSFLGIEINFLFCLGANGVFCQCEMCLGL